jgi:hypothetical protein
MTITCPQCSTQSELEKESLYQGARLSCSTCGNTWSYNRLAPVRPQPVQAAPVSSVQFITINDIAVPFSRVFSLTFQVLVSTLIILIPVWVLLFLLSYKPG